jgi:hypothetical protein
MNVGKTDSKLQNANGQGKFSFQSDENGFNQQPF